MVNLPCYELLVPIRGTPLLDHEYATHGFWVSLPIRFWFFYTWLVLDCTRHVSRGNGGAFGAPTANAPGTACACRCCYKRSCAYYAWRSWNFSQSLRRCLDVRTPFSSLNMWNRHASWSVGGGRGARPPRDSRGRHSRLTSLLLL